MREKARERGERRRSIKEAPIATDSNKLVMSVAYNKPDIAVKSSVLSGLANKLNKLKTNQQENSKERKNFNFSKRTKLLIKKLHHNKKTLNTKSQNVGQDISSNFIINDSISCCDVCDADSGRRLPSSRFLLQFFHTWTSRKATRRPDSDLRLRGHRFDANLFGTSHGADQRPKDGPTNGGRGSRPDRGGLAQVGERRQDPGEDHLELVRTGKPVQPVVEAKRERDWNFRTSRRLQEDGQQAGKAFRQTPGPGRLVDI